MIHTVCVLVPTGRPSDFVLLTLRPVDVREDEDSGERVERVEVEV